MKCPNCGAETNKAFCEFCGTQMYNPQSCCKKCGSTNITFRRENQGEVKSKKAKQIVHRTVGLCKDCGYTWYEAEEKPKKRKTWLWVLGWIFIFPLPLTILVVKNQKLKKGWKIAIIAAAWTLFLLIGIAGMSGNTEPADTNIRSLTPADTDTVTPKPIEVESIVLLPEKTEICIGESLKTEITVSPENAEDKTVTWSSSDKTVAAVDDKGNITGINGGIATISAKANNGVSETFEINVDGSKRMMHVQVTHQRDDDVNIGDDWAYTFVIDGEQTKREYALSVGDKLDFHSRITEQDDNPDVGEAATSYSVTEQDLVEGFSVTMDVYVKENGGKNSGKTAHFIVTYQFMP